jgi:hypothetical protein
VAKANFDLPIKYNKGFEITENNRILLKAGKTYRLALDIHTFGGTSTSSAPQFGFNTNDLNTIGVALYSARTSVHYGQSGHSLDLITIEKDCELTFHIDEWTAAIDYVHVSCEIEELNEEGVIK